MSEIDDQACTYNNRPYLRIAEQQRVHEAENVEGHLLRRECADAVLGLNLPSDLVRHIHKTSAAGPPNNRACQALVFTLTL